jgi:hypothetical protein
LERSEHRKLAIGFGAWEIRSLFKSSSLKQNKRSVQSFVRGSGKVGKSGTEKADD